ncbi:hypothetical protein P0W64_19285 [Tsukamurella sp. 8F]|uniref:AfsR/SARP family transcriptional regulator n=1 Tax=unclassified Tsukamurella TaxID=2633480 RepID=UPI0023B9A3D4|nr:MULTISPECIES: hypothetical protein [unclassified Tsukamurella]MDF0531684.1 hypothetical protein [Tsukamurella sp. 8J]MDF0588930.1 hypothetical protein [Tsukamurella sp. 8F]
MRAHGPSEGRVDLGALRLRGLLSAKSGGSGSQLSNTLPGEGSSDAATSDHPRALEQASPYRAYLFGSLRLFRDDQQIEVGPRRKGVSILLWFLLNPGRPRSADEFVDALWPESDREKAIAQFDVNIHSLKRSLEPGLGPREESSFIRHNAKRVYSFESAELWWTDVADVELLYQRGCAADRAGATDRARFYYRRIAEYVSRGTLLQDEGDWADVYRRKYRLICWYALVRLMEFDSAGGLEEELLESSYQMLRIDKYNPLANQAVINSLMLKGDLRSATKRLEEFREGIQRDHGASLPGEFVELQDKLIG